MNRKLIDKLEEHEREDALLEAGPWRELTRSDFSNGDEIVAAVEEAMRRYGVESKYLHRIYRMMRQRDEIFGQKVPGLTQLPVRTGKRFALRKHSGSFVAYYHTHDFYEMLYVYRGQLVQYGQDGVPEVLTQGDLCLMAPGMIHALGPSKERDVVFKIVIPPDLFSEAARLCPRETRSITELLKKDWVMVRKTGEHFRMLMEMLAEEHLCGKDPREEVTRVYFALILAELSLWQQEDYRKDSEKKNRFTNDVVEYLRGRKTEASLEELADQLGYSADYLGRRIRRECGESFTRLKQRVGMELAAEMLLHDEMSVDETARNLGYQSISGFYKTFENEYGITPGAYRKMMEESRE